MKRLPLEFEPFMKYLDTLDVNLRSKLQWLYFAICEREEDGRVNNSRLSESNTVYMAENVLDLKHIKVGNESLFEGQPEFDLWEPLEEWVIVWSSTSNSGGPTYCIPKSVLIENKVRKINSEI